MVKRMRHESYHLASEWIAEVGRQTGAFAVRDRVECEDCGFDWRIEVAPTSGGPPIRLLVEVKAAVTPQDVLGFLDRAGWSKSSSVPVLCSVAVSPRVAELCRSNGIAYLDAAGNCHLESQGLFIHVEGRKNPHRVTRKAVDPFAAKSSRLTRVLLSDPARGWQVQELAEETEISLGLASRVKRKLTDEAFAEVRDGLLFVRDPRALLKAWAEAYELPKRRSFYVMEDVKCAENRIAKWGDETESRYALTAFSGAWRVAPMVRQEVLSVYVETQADNYSHLTEHLGAKSVDSGANLLLWVPADEYVFYGSRTVGGLNVVSSLQLYLDLLHLPGRGEEAAEEILDKEITWKWPC